MSTSCLPVMSQIALPNLRASLTQVSYSGVPTCGHLTPAGKILAVDHALGAQLHHVIALAFIRDDADGVGTGGGRELHAEHAEAAGSPPHQHVVAGLQRMRRMAVQHAIGGRERERVAGRLLPGEVRRLRHELPRLHAAELRKRSVRRLVSPDALRGRQQRIAAVALFVVAVVLIAVDDHLVAHLPATDFRAAGPDDAGGIGAGDVERILVDVDRRDWDAEAGPYAVVIDAAGHHQNQHLVLTDRPGRQHFELHGGLGRPVPVLADRPCMHLRRHMAERRNFADVVEIFARCSLRRLRYRNGRHGCLRDWKRYNTLPHLMLHRNINARSHRQRGRAQSHSQRHIANCPTRGR